MDQIFRCGWCGNITDEDGDPLVGHERTEAIQYLREFGDSSTIQLTGKCCSLESITNTSKTGY